SAPASTSTVKTRRVPSASTCGAPTTTPCDGTSDTLVTSCRPWPCTVTVVVVPMIALDGAMPMADAPTIMPTSDVSTGRPTSSAGGSASPTTTPTVGAAARYSGPRPATTWKVFAGTAAAWLLPDAVVTRTTRSPSGASASTSMLARSSVPSAL